MSSNPLSLERTWPSRSDVQQDSAVLRFITAGSVDDGKSTLIGRLLHDSRQILEDGYALNGRLSVTSTRLDRTFDTQRIASTQTTVFGEEALNGTTLGHSWVLGAAFVRDRLQGNTAHQ